MKTEKTALVVGLLIVLAVLVVVFFQSGSREVIRKSDPAVRDDPAAASATTRSGASGSAGAPASPADSSKAKPTKTVSVFFVRPSDGLLAPEEREIAASDSLVQETEAFIAELIKGPIGDLAAAVPAETKLGRVYITKEGTAYVDFSRELAEKHPSGTSAELSTVYAVVDGLAFNFKAVKKVFILIDGEERETLAGHIGLDRPLSPH
jgi:spore germination protein GerM